MNQAQYSAAGGPPGRDSQRGPALFRALRLPSDLDAGDLRRGRHERRQPVPLLSPPRRRSSPASPSATAPRWRRSSPVPICRKACSPCSKAWRATISPCARSSRSKLCTEIMAEARRNPEIARISAAFDADVRKWLIDHVQRRRRARRHRQGRRHRRRGRHADDHRRRRLVAARARSELRADAADSGLHGCRAAPAARPRAACGCDEEKSP